VNAVRLNGLLQRDVLQLGEQWTVDLAAAYCRHFEFEYFDTTREGAFAPEYAKLRDRFGVEIVRPV
jgi:hypothetical protein